MEEKDLMVSDLPSGLLICKFQDKEVNVNAISPDSIEIRLAGELDDSKLAGFTLYVYDFAKCTYKATEFMYSDTKKYMQPKTGDNNTSSNPNAEKYFQLNSCVREQFFVSYIFIMHGFSELYNFVVKQYFGYITAKLEGDSINNYPVEKDYDFAQSFNEWYNNKEEIIIKLRDRALAYCKENDTEFAVCLDNYILYKKYIMKDNCSDITPFTDTQYSLITKADRLYIGNQFCHNQFPDDELLVQLLDKAYCENKKITIAFSYLRQELLESTIKTVIVISDWCNANQSQVELIINDYGMLKIIQDTFVTTSPINYEKNKVVPVTLNLGILLNKRRKDPRMKYKFGDGKSPMNQSNQILFGDYLKKSGILWIEQESCGYDLVLDKRFKHSINLPLYQTNTSQFCTLYALCKHHDRSMQSFVSECPRYCESYVCAYPEHLNMIGMYNSLFGLSNTNVNYNGYDRIVWNLF